MPDAAKALPTLPALLASLEERLSHHLSAEQEGRSRLHGPLKAISESHDSFLEDDIANSNEFFAKIWPAEQELDSQTVVDAFVKLVTAVRELDPALQKIFDKLVPRKIKSEVTFWRRYFGHAHALLIRLSPTSDEATYGIMMHIPPPRPSKEKRFAPASGPLKQDGALSAEELTKLLGELADMMDGDETIDLLCREAQAAAKAGVYPSEPEAMTKLAMQYQLEFLEHKGIAHMHGLSQMQPPVLMERFPDQEGAHKPVFEALNRFVKVCQLIPARATQTMMQRPPDDISARRFQPKSSLEITSKDQLDKPKMLEVLRGMTKWIGSDETAKLLEQVAVAAFAEGRSGGHVAEQYAQQKAMASLAMWQREWLESIGVAQDAGFRALWAIPETYEPQPRDSKDPDAISTNVLLQTFGSLRMAIQNVMQRALIEAIKPQVKSPEQRRFAPKEGGAEALQRTGPLSRDFILTFTKKCVEMLMDEESVELLSQCEGMNEIGQLSVGWQRELLEHLGVEQDYGCRKLGEVPHRFGDDPEVMQNFAKFQQACSQSAQAAMKLKMLSKEGGVKAAEDKMAKVEIS